MAEPAINEPQHHFDTEFVFQERASRDTVDFKRAYVDMAGDLLAGLLLSQIVYWHLPGKDGKTKLRVEKGEHLWLAKKREDWWDEVRMSPRQVDRAISILKERGLIVTHRYRFGGAPTTHLRINKGRFMELWGLAIRGQLTQGVLPALNGTNETGKSNLPNGEIQFDESVRSLTETTPETTPEITTDISPPPPSQETPQERMERLRTTHGSDPLEGVFLAHARGAGDETSFTIPETAGGADPFKGGPLTEWCYLVGRRKENLRYAETTAWANELRQIAELRGVSPEILTWALRQWGKAIAAKALNKQAHVWIPGNIAWMSPTTDTLFVHTDDTTRGISAFLAPLLEWGLEHGLSELDLEHGPDQQSVAVEREEPPERIEV